MVQKMRQFWFESNQRACKSKEDNMAELGGGETRKIIGANDKPLNLGFQCAF